MPRNGMRTVTLSTEPVTPDAVDAPLFERCPHTDMRACMRTLKNGVRHAVMQCLLCGSQVRPLRKEETDLRATAQVKEFRDEIADAYWTRRQDARQAQRDQQNAAWWARYDQYLASPEWQRTRKRCLERDAYACQAQMKGCSGHAGEIHHLNYAHVFNEPLFELESVCHSCHQRITAMDHERRSGT